MSESIFDFETRLAPDRCPRLGDSWPALGSSILFLFLSLPASSSPGRKWNRCISNLLLPRRQRGRFDPGAVLKRDKTDPQSVRLQQSAKKGASLGLKGLLNSLSKKKPIEGSQKDSSLTFSGMFTVVLLTHSRLQMRAGAQRIRAINLFVKIHFLLSPGCVLLSPGLWHSIPGFFLNSEPEHRSRSSFNSLTSRPAGICHAATACTLGCRRAGDRQNITDGYEWLRRRGQA